MSQPLEVTDPALDAKEKSEWDKAAKHMLSGGDPDGESEAEEAGPVDDAREFRYRGKTVKVDADTYDLLESLKREARGANGRLGSELARTRERLARMEATIAARSEGRSQEVDELRPPDPLLATRDINAWQAQYTAYQDEKRRREIEALDRRYQAHLENVEQAATQKARDKEWADRFYNSYDHLDDEAIKPIVAQAYTEHKAELDAYGEDIEGAHALLAELADARLVRLKRAGKAADNSNNDTRQRPPVLESSSGTAPRGKPKGEQPDESRRNFSAASWSARERLKVAGIKSR